MESSTDSPTIRPINKGVAHRICAGQVIIDLSSAVKELVENSLDAGATSIEISLKDYGEESFQVIDNGSGISPHNFKVLAQKHHTSKLLDFPDLHLLTTFGFRGEALSSLCILGDLTVETKTKNEPIATHLTFDRSGQLISEKKTARQIGTTVTVKKLFSNLPVRSKEFHRNLRKEYGKLITLLNAYALIAKGVRLVCTNSTGKNAKSVVLKTQGSESLKDNIITVFGMSTYNCLEPININISDDYKVNGYISKSGHGSGRNLGDRQFFFVNGRPIDMPKVSKLVNELYRGANSKQYPIIIMNFIVPTHACDVNVTPDKRKVFFSDESSLLQSLRQAIEDIYSPDRASFSVTNFDELEHTKEAHTPKPFSQYEMLKPKQGLCNLVSENEENLKGKDFMLRVHNSKKNDFTFKSPKNTIDSGNIRTKLIEKCTNNTSIKSPLNCTSIVQSSLSKFVTVSKRKHEESINTTTLSEMPLLRNSVNVTEHKPLKVSRVEEETHDSVIIASNINNESSSSICKDTLILPSSEKIVSTLKFNVKDLEKRRKSRFQSVNNGMKKIGRYYNAATLELSQSITEEGKTKALADATRELEKLFKKEDFGKMKVIGQFNLGFIIGKLDQDLFIVDQHAADEKYNYEHLSQSTVLNQQPLLRPLKMELSPEEEIVISMHMDTIRRNGFGLEEDTNAPPGQRFKLKAVPFSKNLTFGVEDVKELISILADSHGECSMIGSYRMDTCDSVCPPRVRAMLASRACRSSVMIGDPLARNEMRKILEHLAGLKSPWNCPHGRPTMRHLVDLKSVYKRIDEDETAL